MLLTLHLLLKNNSPADGEGRKEAGAGCIPQLGQNDSHPKQQPPVHICWWQISVSGDHSNICAAAKNSSRSSSQTRYFTFVSNLVNLIQTCTWQGQTQYTDVIKTILSSVCKRNPFFAVSSHTVNVYEIPSQLLTPCWALALPAGTGTHSTSATDHGWGRELEAMKTPKHLTTGYGITTDHGSWESSASRTTSQLKLRRAQENINNQLLSACCWHHNITKISLFLDMWDLWSWISHLSLTPPCPPIHNTAFLQCCISSQISSSKHLFSQFSPCSAFLSWSQLPHSLFSLPSSPKTTSKKQQTPRCPLKTHHIWLITSHTGNIKIK